MSGPPDTVPLDSAAAQADTADRPLELFPGATVGEYRVDKLIGQGGMGRVYAATHPVIAKRVAIKVLHPELSADREAVDRFIQEARSVNQIGHPNIVDIFSFGVLPSGGCYFVMELLVGESLKDRLRRGTVELPEALPMLETIAIALAAAHDKGIVHRDLKPDNVFLVDVKTAAPRVKLLDFGIAKLLASDGLGLEHTRTGSLMGTPAYMSPEQARGQTVDHRADVYSLGCVAYEMFTGAHVFPADNLADMVAQHLMTPPPSVRKTNPKFPPELDAVIQRMLAKDPAQRPTLAQFRDVLHRSELVSRRSKAGLAIALALLALAGIGIAIALALQRTGTSDEEPSGQSAVGASAPVQAPADAAASLDPAPAADPVPAPAQPTAGDDPAPQPEPSARPSGKKRKSKTRTKPPPVVDDDAPL